MGSAEPELVFIGGTGRSGTHAIARLIGHHSHFADVPIEARFHCNKRGMPDLLEGRITLSSFLRKLRGFWWHRVRVDGRPRGLYNLLRADQFDDACERFETAFGEDPIAACRGLVGDLLGPVGERRGKPALVEMSSHNVKEAQTLLRIFPEAKIIHALRDGRDSAASVTGKTWGPGNVSSALQWWADRLRAIDRGVGGEEDGARFGIPAGQFRVILLDELVASDRDRGLAELLDFLDVEPEEGMSDFFEMRMTPEAAHLGRWRQQLGAVGRARVDRRYRRLLAALQAEGNHAAPPLLEALEKAAEA